MKVKDTIKLRELYVKAFAGFLKRSNTLNAKDGWYVFLAQPIGANIVHLKFTNKEEFEKLKNMFYREYNK